MLGSYRVIEHIGAGRLGPVYRGGLESQIQYTGGSGGTVAIKVFDQGLSAEQAETLARTLTRLCDAPLDHPSIVAPNGAGLNGQTAWLAEPYVEGTSLETVLERRGSLPFREALVRVTQVAGALDFAAATGVSHGALHPRDILFAGDRTLVTGLGVAQALAVANVEVPVSGRAVSPQLAAGHAVSAADDVFALAAVTFEALYGRPLRHPSEVGSLTGALRGADHVRLRDVLQRALAHDPAERPRTALELARSLHECAVSTETVVHLDPPAGDADADRAAMAAIPRLNPVADVPLPTPVDDLPLRRSSVQPVAAAEFEPDFEAESGRATLNLHQNHVGTNSILDTNPAVDERSVWFPMAAMLAVGLLMGFAAGFVAGQRDFTPAPFSAERPVPRAARETPPEPVPTPTVGQDFTESAVEGRAVEVGPVAPDAGSSEVEARRYEPEALRNENVPPAASSALPSAPSSLEVVSRPSGAQVFIDDRMVGRTPLVLPQVDPGDHSVRIALPGHQRWATTVNVAAGSRARVAASLER
jgi:serine/threonine protein kinase